MHAQPIGIKVYYIENDCIRTWPLFTQGRTFDALVDLLSIAYLEYKPISSIDPSDIYIGSITDGLDDELYDFYNEPVCSDKNDYSMRYGNITYYISYVLLEGYPSSQRFKVQRR